MAAPSYTTDLTSGVVDLAEATTNWAESTDANYDDGGSPTLDVDYPYIQGNGSISQAMTKATICSLLANNGSGITLPTDGAFLVWQIWTSPGAMDTYANGGMRVLVGSALNAFKYWIVGGSDFGRMPYGGWQNHAVNTTVANDGQSTSAPSSTEQYIGAAVKVLTGIGKGNPHAVDAIRWGRCEARMNGGDLANGYATFAGFAATNDSTSNRWGLIQAIDGGFLWKGLVRLGYTSAVDFRDANKTILVDKTPKVTAAFNKIDVEQATSRVDWSGISIQALGTVSKGRFEMVANADVNFDFCTFTDMDTFVFQGNATVNDTTFRRCGQVTVGSGIFDGCTFDQSTAAAAALASSPAAAALIANTTFISDGTGYAIEISGTAANMTLTNVDFSGYAASDGTTGNEAIYVNIASGEMTISISGGTIPSIRTAGCTVHVSASVTLTISAPVSLSGAEVRIYDLDDTLPNLGTELAGTESHGSATYAYGGTAGNVIWIQIMLAGYVEFGQQVTMPTANGSFTALLKKEENA
jgi:hypothetical protein